MKDKARRAVDIGKFGANVLGGVTGTTPSVSPLASPVSVSKTDDKEQKAEEEVKKADVPDGPVSEQKDSVPVAEPELSDASKEKKAKRRKAKSSAEGLLDDMIKTPSRVTGKNMQIYMNMEVLDKLDSLIDEYNRKGARISRSQLINRILSQALQEDE